MSGVTAVPPADDETDLLADDDALAEDDALADDDALAEDDALADDDGLVLGVADAVTEGEDTAAGVGAELVHVEFGVGCFDSVPVGVGLGLGDAVRVGVALGLRLGLTVTLGLVLALAEVLALGLAVLPPAWFPLDDVADAVAFAVGLLPELVVVGVTDGFADGDVQELRGL